MKLLAILSTMTLLAAAHSSCWGWAVEEHNQSDYPIYFEVNRALCGTAHWDTPFQPSDKRTDSDCPPDAITSISITKQHTGPTITITLPVGEIHGADNIRATAGNTDKELILEIGQLRSIVNAKKLYTTARAPLPAQLAKLTNKSNKTIIMSPVKFAADTTSPIAKAGDVYSNASAPNLGNIIIITPKQTMELPAVIPPEYEGSYLQFWVGNVNGPRYTIQAMGASNQVHLRGPDENGQWTDWVFPASLTDYVLVIQANGIPTLVGPNDETRVKHFGH